MPRMTAAGHPPSHERAVALSSCNDNRKIMYLKKRVGGCLAVKESLHSKADHEQQAKFASAQRLRALQTSIDNLRVQKVALRQSWCRGLATTGTRAVPRHAMHDFQQTAVAARPLVLAWITTMLHLFACLPLQMTLSRANGELEAQLEQLLASNAKVSTLLSRAAGSGVRVVQGGRGPQTRHPSSHRLCASNRWTTL